MGMAVQLVALAAFKQTDWYRRWGTVL